MRLSKVALTKIKKDGILHKDLKAAKPDTPFTIASGNAAIINFKMPLGKAVDSPEFCEAHAKCVEKLKTVDGLTIDSYLNGCGCAMISGAAKAIAEMLKLPEVKDATSMKELLSLPTEKRAR